MAKTLYTSKGVAVQVGRELGRGGEGSVHEMSGFTDQVAKLYHKALDPRKQAKLTFMASTGDAQLLKYLAWPQETLHPSRGGPVVGFLMPRVANKAAVHMVYSPAHRRQDYPKAAWDFLLYVARNIAASFETVHAHGHVIGDVNQDSVMVGRDSKVMLVDTDSFQVNARGEMHLCEVGVPHFTSPELQSIKSFHGLTRTVNHDNFGLALLIFHLLFGARHPFSGVPLRNGVGDALETDIKHFRYAYARDGQSRGIAPPPRSIPVSMLPDALESMFHLAFTEKGASGVRPTASQWVRSLDTLREGLKKCSSSGMHVYPGHLGACPWCALERQGVPYFIDLGVTVTPVSGSSFILTRAWALIEACQAPAPLSVPLPDSASMKPKPLPAGITSAGTITFYRFVIVVVALGWFALLPKAWFFAALVGWGAWAFAGSIGSSERNKERAARAAELHAAKTAYEQLVERLEGEAGPKGFLARKGELVKLKYEYEGLANAEKKEVDDLYATASTRQKERFLDSCFIDRATIPGVGPTRKAALRSFGIETAADVTKARVRQVKGFGENLTRAMLDWKASCERRFVYNPNQAVLPSEVDAVRAKFAAKRRAIEGTLNAAPAELNQFRQRSAIRLATMRPQLEAAARRLSQAQADLTLTG
ncbi:helix-hairpin-helix domain-containing protein [uncultured Hydrogenophaga sp.]|uniref:helix-hairpin-helix domain-containing protein n=1 Tax=uncultured Hydrogenophaga sp. TaxID=199683 RepID=UPI002589AB56|nr:helix-hairpin-helix domain-containing protein [uncultured Hydrogenophaga sp.]